MSLPIILAYFTGACETVRSGGSMAIAIVITDEAKKEVHRHSEFFPADIDNSSNVAAYKSFEWLLDYLAQQNQQLNPIIIHTDCKMVVAQIVGINGKKWNAKEGRYLPIFNRCAEKFTAFISTGLHLVPVQDNFSPAHYLAMEVFKQNNITPAYGKEEPKN